MKKLVLLILAAALLLAGCGKEETLVGIWEQEITVSVLGVEGQTEAESIVRFTFREDGTGTQEQMILDGSHPDAVRDFSWVLEKKTLTLDYGEGQTAVFTAIVEQEVLKLENHRGSYELKRTAE